MLIGGSPTAFSLLLGAPNSRSTNCLLTPLLGMSSCCCDALADTDSTVNSPPAEKAMLHANALEMDDLKIFFIKPHLERLTFVYPNKISTVGFF